MTVSRREFTFLHILSAEALDVVRDILKVLFIFLSLRHFPT